MKIIVTGGSGFIGSSVIRNIISNTKDAVINIDKLTYAANEASLKNIINNDRYFFEKADICDQDSIRKIFDLHKPDAVMHLAAESHVDRSINSPGEFIETNIIGTYNMLEVSLKFWEQLSDSKKESFRFHHISTDEVFGDLGPMDPSFTEQTPYAPSSPYSASKAGADHLVRAWGRTYGLPFIITNCSNNYGPYQFPEKLIPLVIRNALLGKSLPIYGDGSQIRDWLYVEDHAVALLKALKSGISGETYNIGGNNEIRNIDIVHSICELLQELKPSEKKYSDLIEFVDDRAGHDSRYAINANKIYKDLDWEPKEFFQSGLRKTVEWYLDNLSLNQSSIYNKKVQK